MQSPPHRLIVLGTGGTIAGLADTPGEALHYRSGVLPVAALLDGVAVPPGVVIESVELARIDSKDMDFATWRALAVQIAKHLARDDVRGIVVTHGTDTLEETAYFIGRVLAPDKPVVFTGAMRPATSMEADGPANLAAALAVAANTDQVGVAAVFSYRLHSARDVRKVHPHRLDAFTSGDAEPLASIDAGQLRGERAWPSMEAAGIETLPVEAGPWPRVAIVTSTAGADARDILALVDSGVNGIVIASTGNGTVHAALEPALRAAQARGVGVLLATRCIAGAIAGPLAADALPTAFDLTPAKARVELIVRLLARRLSA